MYSSDRFAPIFKDASARIEHFMSANLMVSDVSKWKRKVESRMKLAQQTIERIKSGDGL